MNLVAYDVEIACKLATYLPIGVKRVRVDEWVVGMNCSPMSLLQARVTRPERPMLFTFLCPLIYSFCTKKTDFLYLAGLLQGTLFWLRYRGSVADPTTARYMGGHQASWSLLPDFKRLWAEWRHP